MKASDFERQLAAEGFSAPVIGHYEPARFNAPHAHTFEVRGLILSGEMTITPVGGVAVRYCSGEIFRMPLRGQHTEQVGAEGCAYLYGMREG
jgi:uncharacterized cupin superfamily protein